MPLTLPGRLQTMQGTAAQAVWGEGLVSLGTQPLRDQADHNKALPKPSLNRHKSARAWTGSSEK